jgi:hypothetical protein
MNMIPLPSRMPQPRSRHDLGAAPAGGAHPLDHDAAVVRRLCRAHDERPPLGVRGEPAQAALARDGVDRREDAAAADGDQEEQAPPRRAEAHDDLDRVLQQRLGVRGHQRVDLQRDAGGDDALRRGEGPAEAAEHTAQGVVMGGTRTVEAQRHRAHAGVFELADDVVGDANGRARGHRDAEPACHRGAHQGHEISALQRVPSGEDQVRLRSGRLRERLEDVLALPGCQLVQRALALRLRAAMAAREVARARELPVHPRGRARIDRRLHDRAPISTKSRRGGPT